MGTVIKDYLRVHRLAPTQCALNMFRILDSVDALNERMGLNLTHHDVNWIYNLHHLTGQGYYLKSRYLEVKLIQCLLDSNKGLKKDFLIISEEWHDGLPCPTREGKPGRVLGLGLQFQSYPFSFSFVCVCTWKFLWFVLFFANDFFFPLNGFANKNAAIPNFNLRNQSSLDKILKVEVFVHTDGQLKAVHLILDYIPISKSFQAPRCVIKAKDLRLHQISVAALGFLTTDLILEGTLTTDPIPEGIPKVALPSQRST